MPTLRRRIRVSDSAPSRLVRAVPMHGSAFPNRDHGNIGSRVCLTGHRRMRSASSALLFVASCMSGRPCARAAGCRATSAPKLMQDAAVKAAVEAIRAAEPQTIEDQIRLCEVEAPPFKETKRAEVYAQMFREAGLQNVRIDKEGNVLGDRPGRAAAPAPRVQRASRHRVSRRHRRQGEARRQRSCAAPASATTAAASPCCSRSCAR